MTGQSIAFSPALKDVQLSLRLNGEASTESNGRNFMASCDIAVNGQQTETVDARGNNVQDVWDAVLAKALATMNEQMYRTIPPDVRDTGAKLRSIVETAQVLRNVVGNPNPATLNHILRDIFDVLGLHNVNFEALHITQEEAESSERTTRRSDVRRESPART